MLLTHQQRFILEVLDKLGGARLEQLFVMLRPVFCPEHPEIAQRVTEAAVRQMMHRNMAMRLDGDIVYLPGKKPEGIFLEAVDVMLELAVGKPVNYRRGDPPVILRFSVQEAKVRSFSVTTQGAELGGMQFQQTERIILLFDGQVKRRCLPVPNKQFFAVRQSDGTHRFYAADGQFKGGIHHAEKESN